MDTFDYTSPDVENQFMLTEDLKISKSEQLRKTVDIQTPMEFAVKESKKSEQNTQIEKDELSKSIMIDSKDSRIISNSNGKR